jgi:hypothetical protein
MSRSRFGGSGPTLSERDEYLAQQVAGKGVHPIDVARRIISRMPDAWSAVPAQVRDVVPVTTGYNTHWEYRIDKRPDGYVASLTPQDVEARRRTGGKTGGFLGPSGLSGRAFVYRTKGEAYEAIAKHAAKGQYLLQKNPTDFALAYEGRLRDLTRASDGLIRVQMNPDQQYTVNYSGLTDLDSPFSGTESMPWERIERDIRTAEDDNYSKPPKVDVSIGGMKRTFKGDNAAAARFVKSALDAGENATVSFYNYEAYNTYRISPSLRNPSRRGASVNAGLKRGQSLMAKAAAAYRAGKYPNMAAALKGVSGNGGRRSNPTDWALAYEGRLRDLTGESDGLIRVQMNGRGKDAPSHRPAAPSLGTVFVLIDPYLGWQKRMQVSFGAWTAGLRKRVRDSNTIRLDGGRPRLTSAESLNKFIDEVARTLHAKNAVAVSYTAMAPDGRPYNRDEILSLTPLESLDYSYFLNNPKQGRRGGSGAQAAGLKRGQSLMKRAAAAYRSGKYPTMQAALKGESRKG